MGSKAENGTNARGYRSAVVKILAVFFLFPVLWVGITVNFLNIADRLSFLPGISRGGGVTSGVVALVLTIGIVTVVIGGFYTTTGGDFFNLGDSKRTAVNSTTPTDIPSPSPVVTTTASGSKATDRYTPTSTSESSTDIESFENTYRNWVKSTWSDDSLTDIPLMATEYRRTGSGKLELWAVFWECDRAEYSADQWRLMAGSYLNTVGQHSGEEPGRIRIYGVTNLRKFNDTVTYIKTVEAEAGWNGSTSPARYNDKWIDRGRNPNSSERNIAYRMSLNESGPTKTKKAFNETHPLPEKYEDRGCPLDAEGAPQNSGDAQGKLDPPSTYQYANPLNIDR